jgi:uncharacterized membrane protein YhdT
MFPMQRNQEKISAGGVMVLMLVMVNVLILKQGFIADPRWYKLASVSLPLLLVFLIVFYRKQWLK